MKGKSMKENSMMLERKSHQHKPNKKRRDSSKSKCEKDKESSKRGWPTNKEKLIKTSAKVNSTKGIPKSNN